jgi:tetratricopeptide (TPR) repeat protein
MSDPPDTAPCACGSMLRAARCCAMNPAYLPGPPASSARLDEAETLAATGNPAAATLCLRILEDHPGALRALHLLARLRLADGALDAAEALLGRMLALDPNAIVPTCELARLLLRRGKLAEADHHARNAIRIAPDSAEANALMGVVLTELNRPQPGEIHYRRALSLTTGKQPLLLANLAWNLKNQGRIEEARALYRESLEAAPNDIQILLGYGRLEEAANNLPDSAAILDRALALDPTLPGLILARAVVAARLGHRDQALAMLDTIAATAGPSVLMEKGRLLDRMGNPRAAFACWQDGKARLREATGQTYRDAETADLHRRLQGFFTAPRRRRLPRAPVAPGPQPIFVLGFPRSGTTLVEQTLSAHPAIAAGDELPLIHDLAAMLPRVLSSPLGYPEALAELWMGDQQDGLETLRDHYLRRVRAMGITAGGQPWFTDKMPLNETHLGLIGMVFPASPLIHLVRHPLDVVLSVLSNELTHGNFCASALETAARHYARTQDLVAHYRGALALRYLPVRYEDMIENQEATIRRMLDFIGLPFAPSCLAFEQNRRYARTASYAQVTEKLYDRSRFRHRAYRDELAPALPILEPAMARLGYTA